MLSDKVWITRKCRINSEKRLKRDEHISQILQLYYSSLLVLFSVYNLAYESSNTNLLLVMGSIIVLVSTVYLYSHNYNERALIMRNCYIRLDEIYYKALRAEKKDEKDSVKQLLDEYTSILMNIENHSEYDYLCVRYSLNNDPKATLPKFTKRDWISYYWAKIWRFLFLLIFATLPFIILLARNTFTNVSFKTL